MEKIKNILESTMFYKYFKGSADDLEQRWSEPHRFFHTLIHLERILEQISAEKNLTKVESDLLKVAAIYHDIVYLPREDKLNIQESIDKFKNDFPGMPLFHKFKIIDIIHSTNDHNFEHSDKLIRLFNSYDMAGILKGDFVMLVEDGDNVAKEFNLDPDDYKRRRIEFLEKYISYNSEIKDCIEYLKL